MNDKNNGGPAFPLQSIGPEFTPGYAGMTLRQYYAGQALTGMLAHSRDGRGYRSRDPSMPWHQAIAEEAYEIADAMLEARETTDND